MSVIAPSKKTYFQQGYMKFLEVRSLPRYTMLTVDFIWQFLQSAIMWLMMVLCMPRKLMLAWIS